MADSDATRRVELVATATPERLEAGRTGIGLMVGLYVGRSSLLGAATGSERFEVAVAHFVAVVLVSVAGALLLGALWDRARRAAERAAAAEAEPDGNDLVAAPERPLAEGAGDRSDTMMGTAQ